MRNHIVDDMKKEGKVWRGLIILGYALAVLMPLAILLTKDSGYSDKDAIKLAVTFFLFGSLGLYGWLYSTKYHVEITEEKIVLITLFRTKELRMHEITGYSCKRYGKSVFYEFALRTQGRRMQIYTRYQEEFREILKINGIAETS